MHKKIARIVSTILAPCIVGTFFLVTIFLSLTASITGAPALLCLTLFFVVIVPVLINLYFLKTGRISNFDIRKREERPVPFFLYFLSGSIGLLALSLLNAPADLLKVLTIFVVCSAAYILITFRLKISGHLFIFSSSVSLLSVFIDHDFWLLLVLAPVLMWSRVSLKDHEPIETIIGFLYGTTSILLLVFLLQTF